VKTKIFLQMGLDTPVNKAPDGQITKQLREQIPLVSRMEINPSFRGARSAPGIHNHDREYGFRACASKSAVADLDNHIAELG
jgi:hypothetical protein